MCRLAAYCGPSIPLENIVIKPAHSLVVQSQVAEEAKLAVNGDGFGLAWYGSPAGTVHDPNMQPALYKEIMPAWANPNLLHLCRAIAAPVFLAHVRASTFGGASYQNCHPFTHGRWSFVHNGQIGGFGRLRRQLEGLLPDDLFAARLGITDSELLFLLMVSCNLEADPRQACRSAIEKIHALWREIPGPERTALRLTFVLTDGETLYGCRYSSDGRAPTQTQVASQYHTNQQANKQGVTKKGLAGTPLATLLTLALVLVPAIDSVVQIPPPSRPE